MRRRIALRAIAIFALVSCLAATLSAIDLDGTFGTGGKFMTSFASTGNPSSFATRVYVQPSGRIVVVGGHQQQGADGRVNGVALAGLTNGGALDGTFASGGKALIWNFNSNQGLTDSAMLPNGAILVLYQWLQFPSTNKPLLVKFTPEGQIDGAFSANLELVLNANYPVRIALGADSKIYALIRESTNTFYLLRLNSDGSRDTTFGPNGVRNINLNRIPTFQRSITGLQELEGGKILVTGQYTYTDTFETYGFVMRFDSDTNLDRSFGRQGVFAISIPDGSVGLNKLIVQPDGKLIVGGYYTFLGSYALLVRLTTRGRFDGSFGSRGIVMASFNSVNAINGIALAPDGKIIVAGSAGEKALPSHPKLFVARFSAAGVRESFLVTDFILNRDAGGSDVALQTDGKMVVGGFTQNPSDNLLQLAAARFTP